MQSANDGRPSALEVLQMLEQVASGSLTRAEGATWAARRRDAQVPRDQFGAIPQDGLAVLAFWALLSAEVCERDLTTVGAPYFIRDVDLRAWITTLRREDAPRAAAGAWQAKHPHEIWPAPHLAALVRISSEELRARVGLEHLRGCDDLDYYQDVCADDPAGRQIVLSWRPRGPTPDEAKLRLEGGGSAWRADLADAIAALGLAPDAITWRPARGGGAE
jgi:hypothetical protein